MPRDRKYRHFFTSNSWRYLLKNEGARQAICVCLLGELNQSTVRKHINLTAV